MRKKLLLVLIIAAIASCGKTGHENGGLVKMLQGQAELLRAGAKNPLRVGDRVEPGDTILTGSDGIVVLQIRGSQALAEIQPNASFQLNTAPSGTEVKLDRGNAWLQVSRASASEEFYVRTPTTLAGVRGTKFHTSQFEDLVAVCHCQGDVEFSAGSEYKSVHHTDMLVFARKDGKTVLIKPGEFPELNHSHSLLKDSPLGNQDTMSPETRKKLLDAVRKKFAELDRAG